MFFKLLLAPILLYQGKHVKRKTPRLPEAAGPRSGQVMPENADDSTCVLRVLICGDSAAAGVGVGAQTEALSGQLLTQLQGAYPNHRIEWTLWAKNGDTTAVALIKLHLRQAQDFDLVITSLGVNDVTSGLADYRFRRQQLALVKLLQDKYKARWIYLTDVPPMHLFPALPQPLRWYLGRQARRLSYELERVASAHERVSLVRINFPLAPNVIASDGFHPGPAGYPLWAQAIVRQLQDKRHDTI
ncbi:SGNH/GDSL hydrolase family protein [Aliidiomarina haloalkalitolerans]|uniref:Lipase n=1 Tax=Aliidiomarina haloalkalitolerans TaxID=859059 RepID=A0A432VQC2_9GAMM|nr:SGNH/GDSL hydrolase family protein [Aliidiomarina haloalkalitolerans]RUO18367.1 lipase [Aliidiomarina haloalkalitolerans]